YDCIAMSLLVLYACISPVPQRSDSTFPARRSYDLTQLVEAAVGAARAIDHPVVGLDFLVPSPTAPDYVIIEANERPGLANHEPAPTAQRFIDLLFPHLAS